MEFPGSSSTAGGSGNPNNGPGAQEIEIVFKLHPKMKEQKELVSQVRNTWSKSRGIYIHFKHVVYKFVNTWFELFLPDEIERNDHSLHQDDGQSPGRTFGQISGHENLPRSAAVEEGTFGESGERQHVV